MNIFTCGICGNFVPEDSENTTTLVIKNRAGINCWAHFHNDCLPAEMKKCLVLAEPAFVAEKV